MNHWIVNVNSGICLRKNAGVYITSQTHLQFMAGPSGQGGDKCFCLCVGKPDRERERETKTSYHFVFISEQVSFVYLCISVCPVKQWSPVHGWFYLVLAFSWDLIRMTQKAHILLLFLLSCQNSGLSGFQKGGSVSSQCRFWHFCCERWEGQMAIRRVPQEVYSKPPCYLLVPCLGVALHSAKQVMRERKT